MYFYWGLISVAVIFNAKDDKKIDHKNILVKEITIKKMSNAFWFWVCYEVTQDCFSDFVWMVQKEKFPTFLFCRVKQFIGLASKDYYYFLAVFPISLARVVNRNTSRLLETLVLNLVTLALDLSSKQKVYFSEIINAFGYIAESMLTVIKKQHQVFLKWQHVT